MKSRLEGKLEKIAVTLDQLRKGTRGLKLFRGRGLSAATGKLTKAKKLSPEELEMYTPAFAAPGKITKKTRSASRYLGELQGAPKEVVEGALKSQASLRRGVYTEGSPYRAIRGIFSTAPREFRKSFPRNLSPKSREAFNRAALLHERAEIAKHPGKLPFFSHLSTRPVLQDMNIAATLKGEGSGASKALRGLRKAEVQDITNTVPGADRLQIGKRRLSRHAIKRLQEAYDRQATKMLSAQGIDVKRLQLR